MSFSKEVKLEIIENKPYRAKAKIPQAYGLFVFAHESERAQIPELAELYAWLAKSTGMQKLRDAIPDPLKLGEERDIDALISGAFLACGSVSDPGKAYRLEFVTRDEQLAGTLAALIEKRAGIRPAITKRRGQAVVYLAGCEQVEDILTMIGASKAALAVIDVEMIKQVRNQANRAANCVTANITKQVYAAAKQIEDIQIVLRETGAESLPDTLKQAAALRLENPEASLGELAKLSPEPVSRSGLFHRYAAIGKMAGEIREGKI